MPRIRRCSFNGLSFCRPDILWFSNRSSLFRSLVLFVHFDCFVIAASIVAGLFLAGAFAGTCVYVALCLGSLAFVGWLVWRLIP